MANGVTASVARRCSFSASWSRLVDDGRHGRSWTQLSRSLLILSLLGIRGQRTRSAWRGLWCVSGLRWRGWTGNYGKWGTSSCAHFFRKGKDWGYRPCWGSRSLFAGRTAIGFWIISHPLWLAHAVFGRDNPLIIFWPGRPCSWNGFAWSLCGRSERPLFAAYWPPCSWRERIAEFGISWAIPSRRWLCCCGIPWRGTWLVASHAGGRKHCLFRSY